MIKKIFAATGLIIGLAMFLAFFMAFMGYVTVELETFKLIAAFFFASQFLIAISINELGDTA